jgi:hypothetical protein
VIGFNSIGGDVEVTVVPEPVNAALCLFAALFLVASAYYWLKKWIHLRHPPAIKEVS